MTRVAGTARALHARNRLLTLAGWSLTAGLGFGLPIVVALRLGLGASWWWGVPLGLALAALLGTGVFVLARRWSLAHAAGEIDRANETDGALRTAIEIDDRDGEPVFVAMARRRGESIAAQADPARAVPPARFEGWRWAAGAAAACVLAGVFVPQIERRDPGTRAEVSPVAQRAAEEVSTARAETERVEESALPEPESWSRARAELEALEEELRRGDADDDAAARTAAAMDRAAEELERQNELAAQRERELSDRAASFDRKDRGRGGELSERLADALARNDMLRAEEIAREIDRTAPTLSEEERRELSDALEDLASRLEPDSDAPDQDQPAGTEDRDPADGPRPEPTPDDPTDPSRPTEPAADPTADPTEPPPGEEPTRQDPDRPTDPPAGDDPERRDQQTDDPRRDQQQDQQQQGQQQQGQNQQAEEQQGQQQGQQQQGQEQQGQQQQGQQQEGQEQPGGEDPERPGERPGDADTAERPGEEGTRGERDPSRSVSEALRERARELREGSEEQPRPDPAQDAEAPQREPGEGSDEAEPEPDQGREQPAERPDPDQPAQDQPAQEQPGQEQGAQEQPDPDQPGDPRPGEGRPDGEQPGEQDGQAPPGSLERAVRQIREQRDAREQNQRVAENLRQRARDMIDPADRAPGGPGEDETRLAESGADARPVEFEPVDASGAPDPDADSRVVGEWFDPDRTEMPAAERRAAADELRRAAGRARDAVENQQVPRHRRELVQRVFERLGRRAEEVGSGSTVAPQGRDANP